VTGFAIGWVVGCEGMEVLVDSKGWAQELLNAVIFTKRENLGEIGLVVGTG
jgi:hypothetical protein